MKENIEELIKKYETGESSLAEETFLTDHNEKINTVHKPWFKFIQRNRQTVPQELSASVWEAVQSKRSSRRRLNIGIISAAASVVILLSVFVFNSEKNKLSYHEKEAMLNEALSMFNNETTANQTVQNVLYEDNMIVIYMDQE